MKTANGSYLVTSTGAFIVASLSVVVGPTRAEVRWAGRMSTGRKLHSRVKTRPKKRK